MANIDLSINVNTDTGALEVLGAKFEQTGKKAEQASGSFGQLSGQAGQLLKSLLPLATAGGIVAFFTNAVKGAEAENESLRRLKFTIESTGQSWDKNKASIDRWASSMQNSTRFSDGEALEALDRLARSTNNVTQAQKAAQLAMSLSVATGKQLTETTDIVNGLINKQERAIMASRKEFGNYVGQANTAQEVLDALAKSLGEAAFTEEGLTRQSKDLRNALGEISDSVGHALIPSLTWVAEKTAAVTKKFEQFALILASFAAKATVNVGRGWKEAMAAIDAETEAQFAALEEKRTAKHIVGSDNRIQVTARETQEELRLRQEMHDKAEQMSLELDQRMAQMGQSNLQTKYTELNAEVAIRRAKINREIRDEQEKTKLLAKLAKYETDTKALYAKQDVMTKMEAAFMIGNLAVQTLQIVNSMGDKGSSAERTRAKALLALQQSIAIGWAWVNAMKVGGPFAVPLAAATTALLTAQFAQGIQNIDRAGQAEAAGLGSIQTRGPVPGIDSQPVNGGIPGEGGSGGGLVSTSGGGGGGGGGGPSLMINVGGIVNNIQFDKLAIDNIDFVMRQITERVRQGTNEGIQMAVTVLNLANKKSQLAV